MSEKTEKSDFFSNIKKKIMAGIGVILTGIGTMFMNEIKEFVGINDEEDNGAKIENVQEQKQEVNVSGPEIIINVPEQKTETKTIIKEVPAEEKKEKEETIDW